MTCLCGHHEALHDLRKDNSRSACSVSTGPQATRCGCTSYRPAEEKQ